MIDPTENDEHLKQILREQQAHEEAIIKENGDLPAAATPESEPA